MHSILESISQPCGAKLHCELPSQLILRSLVGAMPSPKPFKNMDREHQVGPWLIQCLQDLQRSVDFNSSLHASLGRMVFVTIFAFRRGSSASCVRPCLPLSPSPCRAPEAIFWGQSGPTSTCLVNSHYVLGGGWEMCNLNV